MSSHIGVFGASKQKPFVMATYGDTTSLPPKVLSVQPVGAPGFKMERWASNLAKSIQGLWTVCPNAMKFWIYQAKKITDGWSKIQCHRKSFRVLEIAKS